MALVALTNRIPPLFFCLTYLGYYKVCSVFIFIGNYLETVNDANVAIELQPHFPKAFVRGKSFNSYKTLKSFVADTTDVWGYKPWTYGIPRGGGGGGKKIFGGWQISFEKGQGGICKKFWQTKGGRGVANFFLLLLKKEALFLDFLK